MILVSGATGRVGGQVAAQLTAAGVRIRALTRTPAADHVVGDLADPDTLAPILDGVDAVFLVFPSVTADAAAPCLVRTLAAHTNRIVYLSAAGVPDDPTTGGGTPDGTIMGSHAHLEHLIATSGMDWTFLRSSGLRPTPCTGPPRSERGTPCAGSTAQPPEHSSTSTTWRRWRCAHSSTKATPTPAIT